MRFTVALKSWRVRVDAVPVKRSVPGALAVAAAVLAGAVFTPGASAVGTADLNAVITDFAGDGDITACKFSKAQLEYVRSQISPDIDAYAPDLRGEVNGEIARWTNGGCGSSNAGNGNGATPMGASRATIKSLKVAKNRRSVKVKLKCPAAAPASCKVKISGKLAGKTAAKSKSATVARGKTRTVKVTLKSSARNRLKSKGGKLKMSAKTTGSTLAAASRSINVAAG